MKTDFFTIVLAGILAVSLVDLSIADSDFSSRKKVSIKKEEKPEIKKVYGIPADEFRIEKRETEAGMYLGKLLSDYHIRREQRSKIIASCKGVFDFKKMRRGQKFSVFYAKDETDSVPEYLVYEKNKTDYVVFDFGNAPKVYLGKKELKKELKKTGGIIRSALWFALEEADADPLLANDLSEIYAWSVDFFGLQKRDKFKILYEEYYTEQERIGSGEIVAAYFEHKGEKIYAIPFKQDSTIDFFNFDGTALRKAFLKAPLKFSRISSGFSNNRLHPILKIRRPHHGVDYAAPSGTPVYALGDGTVIHAAYTGGAGHYVKIKHNGTYTTGYMHLRDYAPGISPGKRVKQGQLIGYVGSTGLSTGPHLDFRVWKNGQAVNPLDIDAPPSVPVKKKNLNAFKEVRDKYKKMLDAVPYKNAGLAVREF